MTLSPTVIPNHAPAPDELCPTLTECLDKDVVLATDLDGTFLGGSPEERAELYQWIEDNRANVGLIFVTGRPRQLVEALFDGPVKDKMFNKYGPPRQNGVAVPRPDVAISDCGAGVWHGHDFSPVEPLMTEISDLWGPERETQIRELFDGEKGLALDSSFKLALGEEVKLANCFGIEYFEDQMDISLEEVRRRVESLDGLDVVISHGAYIDILPMGWSKGPTLERTLARAGVLQPCHPVRVVVAGDTMNDYCLLSHGYKSIMVGNADHELRGNLDCHAHLYRADAHGAGGIIEALKGWNFW
ncbi:MAG: hypothetical protein Alpg2KO_17150 [Alphaproteobacteria bacterium]